MPDKRADKRETLLHVAVSGNMGLIYCPSKVFAGTSSLTGIIYRNFFRPGAIYQTVPIITERGPGELSEALEEYYAIERGFWIGGIIVPFGIDEDNAEALLKDLTENPERYFKARERTTRRICGTHYLDTNFTSY